MTTPAGWYDDPGAPGSGQLRWWDGAAWTSHVRGPEAARPAQPAAQPATGQYPAQYGQQYGQQQPYAPAPAYAPAYPAAYTGKPTHTADGVALANVWARLGAKVIDGLLIGALNLLLLGPFWPGLVDAVRRYVDEVDRTASTGVAPDPFALYSDPGYQRFVLAGAVIGGLVSVLYIVLMLRFKGATLGKMALGMRVRKWDADGQLGWGTCFGRWAGEVLIPQVTCGLFFWIDSLWCLWDPRRQTLHDKMVGTVVVKR